MKSAFSVHNVFGDGMVFQRGRTIRVSGTAVPGIRVFGAFAGSQAEATAGDDGEWVLSFPPMEAGGPHELAVSITCGSRRVSRVFRGILVGEVWFCSGQSNMSFPVHCPTDRFYGLRDGVEVARAAHDDGLRLLNVSRSVSPDGPCSELPLLPEWHAATSFEPVAQFSAVGYWFGVELRRRLGVPVGMIHGSWGGTMIEPWIPRAGFEDAGLGAYTDVTDAAIAAVRKAATKDAEPFDPFGGAYRDWIREKFEKTDPATTAAALASWFQPGNEPRAWRPCKGEPATELVTVGTVWFRQTLSLPKAFEGRRAILHVDHIDDADDAWVDGKRVGGTTAFEKDFWCKPRDYTFMPEATTDGLHTVVFRVQNHFGVGSLCGDAYVAVGDAKAPLPLAGWECRHEFAVDSNLVGTRPSVAQSPYELFLDCQLPTTLYNAMVHPATEMEIGGVVWYQGSSNIGQCAAYAGLQAALIESWRKAWRNPGMPFLITQLASFSQHRPGNRLPDDFWKDETPESAPGYAPMRAVQETFLDYPGSGVACTIDVGDHSSDHPQDKKSVGFRLAHEAMRVAYGNASCAPGPRARSARRVEGGVEVVFDNTGEGLEVPEGALGPHLAAIAGEDGAFVWADAEVRGRDTLFIRDPGVPGGATRVQYAYNAFAPGPFLRRKGDGLPAFPFRTDVAR